DHPSDTDRTTKIDEVDMGVRGHDRAGQHKETGCHRIEVANRAVGDDTDAAESLVDVALHLAPERAKSLIRPVDVLDHGDAGQRLGGYLLIIGETHSRRFFPAARMRF